MPLMQWSEKMSVGLAELDSDHKQLIRVINQLGADAINRDRRDAVRQSLFALLRYAEFHFAREEKVMAACQYPGIEEHKIEHREFVDKMHRLSQSFDENPEDSADVVNETLLNYLQDWLNHHILIEDKAYCPYALRNPEAQEAARTFKAIEVWWAH